MDVCTIIAKNYVSHARVLARSFAAQHPGGRVHVLVIDDHAGYLDPADEPFTVVTPAELGIDRFETMAALYDVIELSTAVKPWLLRWMLDRSADGTAMYLDPDMRIYAPLDEVYASVREHRLVLSPHNVDPMPRDGKRPNEQDILISGAYNLGFIGIAAGEFADLFLRWWSERLQTDCIVDSERGFFVDQRWIDLVPGMAPSFHILRDRGFNVAYWNLASRPVSRTAEDVWMAGDVPLRLFHFSGFEHDVPHVLSKHQDRIRDYEHEPLATLCAEYALELRAEGAPDVAGWPYSYAATASGLRLTTDIRRAYRELHINGELEESIFHAAGEAALVEKLNAPAAAHLGGAFGVTRYLASLHEHHAHLRRAFPDLPGVDGPRYLEWVHSHSRGEVPEPLFPPAAGTQAGPRAPAAATGRALGRPFGINVAGYAHELDPGSGGIAPQAVAALDAAGVPLLPVQVPAPGDLPLGGYPMNLICVNADQLGAFARDVGPEFFAGRDSIGWWWDLAQSPEQALESCGHVGELWAASHFVADALAAVAPVPVTRVPVPVTVPGSPRSEPGRFGLPAGFCFLSSYVNALGAIEAFLRAFPAAGEANLVLQSSASSGHVDDHAHVRRAAAGHSHIVLFDRRLERVDRDRLAASCDAYLSLHRAEGFGMTMAEAMFLAQPVIATGYSGNRDFMTPENSWLVDYELAAQQAEPDLGHAAVLMREVFDDRAAARARAARGARDIRRTHAPEVVGAQMASLLRDIATRLPEPRGGWEDPPALARARAANELLRAGPRSGAASAAGSVRRSVRRLLLRVMKPHTAYQHQVDRALADVLESINADIRDLTERGLAAEARTLLALRDLERRTRERIEPDEAGTAETVERYPAAPSER